MALFVSRHRLPCGQVFRWAIVVGGVLCCLVCRTDASELRRTPIVRAIEEAAPSIVNIHGRKTVRGEQSDLASGTGEREVNGMGTGVVIDERGYILTNFHVVDGVANIQVTLLDEHTVVGRIVGHDAKTDLAVIKIDVTESIPVIRLGTATDLMVGESVIAVGNAYGYTHTATEGIVSQLHRSVQVSDTQKYHDLIQTSASINPGNSGGPLMNIDGDVIAINVAVRVGAQGIGFAIPIDEAMDVAAKLMSAEKIDRLYHGITGTTQIVDDQPQFVVQSVAKDSPAEAAGIQVGDVIVEADHQPVRRVLDFERRLVGHRVDDEIEMTIDRGEHSMKLTMTLAESAEPLPSVAVRVWDALGMKLTQLPSNTFRQVSTKYRGGLKIVSVRPDGPAAKQGIRPGDILVGIHRWETVSIDNVAYIINSEDLPTEQPVKFFIVRGGETLYGMLRLSMNDSGRKTISK